MVLARTMTSLTRFAVRSCWRRNPSQRVTAGSISTLWKGNNMTKHGNVACEVDGIGYVGTYTVRPGERGRVGNITVSAPRLGSKSTWVTPGDPTALARVLLC